MTLLFMLIVFAIALCLSVFNRIKSSHTVAIIAVMFSWAIGSGIFSFYLLNYLESYPILIHPEWKKRNAIVLLGAGTVKLSEADVVKPTTIAYSRIYEASRLYFSCKKTNAICTIIISGGDALSTGKSEAAVYQDALHAIGIRNADMILESKSMNTYANAKFTSVILQTKQFDDVFLVTSGIHMKRALLYFSHFGIKAVPSMADFIPPKISMIPLGYYFALTDFVLHEYIGIIRFYL